MMMMMMMPQVIRANRFHFKPLKYSTYWHTDVGHYSPHVLFQVYYKPRGLVKASKYLLLWLFTHVEQSNRSTRTRSRTRTRTSTRTRTDTHFERLCVRNSQQRAALTGPSGSPAVWQQIFIKAAAHLAALLTLYCVGSNGRVCHQVCFLLNINCPTPVTNIEIYSNGCSEAG